ncbi:hypothetical protein BKA66DRAFT_224212 [Pyrenochaeta sp. MPI-SDFR-AT-0127]|nr:hypothetical protein BKA66DRAFT_224212 [Pyrenochaeta sp. MPI-SDFR-AT-0127]
MEYSDKTRPWQWDDRREDWYYYNDTTLQWVYSNGRIYPEPGQARFSAPTPQSSYHQAQPLPGAAPNYDICYRRDVPYHPISPVEHLNAPQSQALYGPQSPSHTYPIQQQSPNGFSVVEPRPQQAIYQSTSPATYAAPRLSHHAA